MPTQAVLPPSQVSAAATIIGPRVVVGTVPPVATDWIQTVPPGFIWNVKSIYATLETSAVAGARIGPFEMSDGAGAGFYSRAPTQVQPASTVQTHNFSNTGREAIAGNFIVAHTPMPDDIWLLPGYVFRVRYVGATLGYKAGDQWTAPQFWIMEYAAND